MTKSPESPTSPPTAFDPAAVRRRRIRKESILAGVCLGLGLIVLPGLIYAFGVSVLGAYGGGPHVGSFYGDFFRNLAAGTFRTWLIVLTPYLLLTGLRLIFRAPRPDTGPPAAALESTPAPDPAQARPVAERREPFVSP